MTASLLSDCPRAAIGTILFKILLRVCILTMMSSTICSSITLWVSLHVLDQECSKTWARLVNYSLYYPLLCNKSSEKTPSGWQYYIYTILLSSLFKIIVTFAQYIITFVQYNYHVTMWWSSKIYFLPWQHYAYIKTRYKSSALTLLPSQEDVLYLIFGWRLVV